MGDLKVFEEGSALFVPTFKNYPTLALYAMGAVVKSQDVSLAVNVMCFSHCCLPLSFTF
jgi:hypothetical protein